MILCFCVCARVDALRVPAGGPQGLDVKVCFSA